MKASKELSAIFVTAWFGAVALVLSSCATTSETGKSDAITEKVGEYTLAPTNLWRPKVGVPAFKAMSTTPGKDGSEVMESRRIMATIAADQLTTLAVKSDRFKVYERAQLDQLLTEQRLTNVVSEGTLVKQGKIRGVDYLLLGQVTNFRVKAAKSDGGVAGIGGLIRGFGGRGVPDFDFKNKNSMITAECGVDLRLVDPQTGRAVAAESHDFKKTDKISAIGITVQGVHAESDGELTVSQDDNGKILRLALDGALRKMLPSIDKELLAHVETPATTPLAREVKVNAQSGTVPPQESALKRAWSWLTTW